VRTRPTTWRISATSWVLVCLSLSFSLFLSLSLSLSVSVSLSLSLCLSLSLNLSLSESLSLGAVQLKHKWLWRSDGLGAGSPYALDGRINRSVGGSRAEAEALEGEWTEYTASESRALERGLAIFQQDRTKHVITIHIGNTSRDAAREIHGAARVVLHPYVVDFERWIPLPDRSAPGVGKEPGAKSKEEAGVVADDGAARQLAAEKDAAETKNTIAVPSAPPDGAPSSRRRQPIETGKPGKPEEPISQLGPQPEPEVGVPTLKPEEPISQLGPQPEPEVGFPTLPGQVGLVHVDEKKPEEHPKSKKLRKSVSFKEIDSPPADLAPGLPHIIAPAPTVSEDRPAAKVQPKMLLRRVPTPS
jgi:hypothetical protein